MEEIVHSLTPLTLVGGGPIDTASLREALTIAPRCVAADGGLQAALDHGVMPEAVIGDLDSAGADYLAQMPQDRLHHIAEQNSTDFDKALRSISAPVVIAVGFSGGRSDHQLAAFHTLVRRVDRPCVMICEHDIAFHCPPKIVLPMAKDQVVSLFPMCPITGHSTGLQWPIDGLHFAPEQFVGTSNRALGEVTLEMDGHGMLCIVDRQYLDAVTHALAAAPRYAPRGARAG